MKNNLLTTITLCAALGAAAPAFAQSIAKPSERVSTTMGGTPEG